MQKLDELRESGNLMGLSIDEKDKNAKDNTHLYSDEDDLWSMQELELLSKQNNLFF